jgi:hypothetical protein
MDSAGVSGRGDSEAKSPSSADAAAAAATAAYAAARMKDYVQGSAVASELDVAVDVEQGAVTAGAASTEVLPAGWQESKVRAAANGDSVGCNTGTNLTTRCAR